MLGFWRCKCRGPLSICLPVNTVCIETPTPLLGPQTLPVSRSVYYSCSLRNRLSLQIHIAASLEADSHTADHNFTTSHGVLRFVAFVIRNVFMTVLPWYLHGKKHVHKTPSLVLNVVRNVFMRALHWHLCSMKQVYKSHPLVLPLNGMCL